MGQQQSGYRWLAAAFAWAVGSFALVTAAYASSTQPPDAKVLARGKYVVLTSGCNDCHTPRYVQAAGKVPEKEWLTGDALGWRGPWGTTYPTNLRLVMPRMTQEEWLKYARTMEPRPPMPWFNVRAMSDPDLIAMYHYVKALGPAGQPAPAYVPPGKIPSGPVVQFPQP
jgi:mono/diheme cytochrome c family protein